MRYSSFMLKKCDGNIIIINPRGVCVFFCFFFLSFRVDVSKDYTEENTILGMLFVFL